MMGMVHEEKIEKKREKKIEIEAGNDQREDDEKPPI
jgi:hypothetical protein